MGLLVICVHPTDLNERSLWIALNLNSMEFF